MKTVFMRVLEAEDKATALLEAAHDLGADGRCSFDLELHDLAQIPGSPFAYWVSDRIRSLFKNFPRLENGRRVARAGGQTSDDERYLRSYWELRHSRKMKWRTYLKGGRAQKFYFDPVLVAPWDEFRQTFPGFLGRPGRASEKPSNCELYFRPGLTWPLRAGALSPQAMPSGSIFTVRSYALIDDQENLLPLLALMASSSMDFMAKLLLGRFGFPEFVVGVLQKLPVPTLSHEDRAALAQLASRCWFLQRSLEGRIETSHAFTLPTLLQVDGTDVAARGVVWSEHVREVEAERAAIQAEIDERCFVLYGIDESDRHDVSEGFGPQASEGSSDEELYSKDDDGSDDDDNKSVTDSRVLAAELVSWAVGVAFGRFDVRLGNGVRDLPQAPEPFDQLPVCSVGMLTGGNGLSLAQPPTDYPLRFPHTGVLVDDLGNAYDLRSSLRAVFDVVFGTEADRWRSDVASLLDSKGYDLRVWLAESFFEHHLKRYSKSGRKAPIYWQLATPSASYSVWLYAHRLTRDSFFQIQKDIVEPKLAHEERELTRLVQGAGPAPTSQQRKEIAEQETFVAELRAFRDEIARVAPLWNPNFDDGVVIVTAPLWRLFPHHKPWQKELKGYWDELCAGKYNWSHLAMHLWPERVVPNCATDRSIAIAHDLEDVFWIEEANGKWKPRPKPTRPIEELIAERTSPAVKAALKSLIEAPSVSTTSRRRRA